MLQVPERRRQTPESYSDSGYSLLYCGSGLPRLPASLRRRISGVRRRSSTASRPAAAEIGRAGRPQRDAPSVFCSALCVAGSQRPLVCGGLPGSFPRFGRHFSRSPDPNSKRFAHSKGHPQCQTLLESAGNKWLFFLQFCFLCESPSRNRLMDGTFTALPRGICPNSSLEPPNVPPISIS